MDIETIHNEWTLVSVDSMFPIRIIVNGPHLGMIIIFIHDVFQVLVITTTDPLIFLALFLQRFIQLRPFEILTSIVLLTQ